MRAVVLAVVTGALALGPAGCASTPSGPSPDPATGLATSSRTDAVPDVERVDPDPTQPGDVDPDRTGPGDPVAADGNPVPLPHHPHDAGPASLPVPHRLADACLDRAPGAAPGAAEVAFRRLTRAQRVGQLFMAGTPATAASATTLRVVARQHVGSVILTGRSHAGAAATRAVTRRLQAAATTAATGGVPLVVSADQEGGNVQVLQGPGFSRMPTALTQGGWTPAALKRSSSVWGRQLAGAGVNLNLAPVMDTVPSAAAARTNPPIGYYRREFGYTPATVAGHGTAFLAGMASSRVATAVKHFPGLGRVRANTDTSAGVTDTVTTAHDAYLAPFAAGVRAGTLFLMPSTAYYSRIDPRHPAAFSATVLQGLVRRRARLPRRHHQRRPRQRQAGREVDAGPARHPVHRCRRRPGADGGRQGHPRDGPGGDGQDGQQPRVRAEGRRGGAAGADREAADGSAALSRPRAGGGTMPSCAAGARTTSNAPSASRCGPSSPRRSPRTPRPGSARGWCRGACTPGSATWA